MIDQLRVEIPDAIDQALVELMVGGVTENVREALRMVRTGMDKTEVVAPPVALEYARRIAQRGIPISALLRGSGWVRRSSSRHC